MYVIYLFYVFSYLFIHLFIHSYDALFILFIYWSIDLCYLFILCV